MHSVHVAVSQVQDGSMYTPTEQTNKTVIQSRATWLREQEIALNDATRVHISYDQKDFCRYRIVDTSRKGEGMQGPSREYSDALVTANPGHVLFLPVADCVATTLFDPENGVLMLSHLGRHSLEQDGGVRSVAFLAEKFGSNPERLKVWLSPAPNKQAYPIFKLGGSGMKEAVFEQLQRAGVLLENITDNPADTATDDNYFSHSEFIKGNKSVEGRFAMVAVMQPM
ncbi:MAG: laccase domain-containing protein [Candidatus Microsaccharimonas sp.]